MVPFPFHHNRPFFPSNTTSSSPALGGEGRKSRRDVATAVRESAAAHLPRRPSVKPRSQTSLRRTRGSASTLDLPAPARRAGLVNHELVPHGFGSQPGVLQKVPWSPCHTGQSGWNAVPAEREPPGRSRSVRMWAARGTRRAGRKQAT